MGPVGVCLSPPGLICPVPFQFAVTGPAKARHRDAPLCKRRGDRYLHYNQLWVLSAVVAHATDTYGEPARYLLVVGRERRVGH